MPVISASPIMPKGSINILSWQLTDDGASGIVQESRTTRRIPRIFMLPRFETILMMYGATPRLTVAIMGVGKEKAPLGSLSFREDQ